VHTICGLTNVSYGLPARKLVNRVFLAGAIAAGMDSAIIDPTDTQLMAVMLGAEAVFGRDEYCMNLIDAFHSGKLA
jgi:5-methyltetrahydrofolate--homocysteine methyltransferase